MTFFLSSKSQAHPLIYTVPSCYSWCRHMMTALPFRKVRGPRRWDSSRMVRGACSSMPGRYRRGSEQGPGRVDRAGGRRMMTEDRTCRLGGRIAWGRSQGLCWHNEQKRGRLERGRSHPDQGQEPSETKWQALESQCLPCLLPQGTSGCEAQCPVGTWTHPALHTLSFR